MNIEFNFYWSLFLRRLPVMMALFLVCSAFGIVTARTLPPTYSTSARLLVEAPRIEVTSNNRNSANNLSGAEQLRVIEQQLMTRANMIDIANKFNVFEDIREMSPDAVFAEMVRRTRIRTTSGRQQATIMELRFDAPTGQAAASVVNEYLSLVLEMSSDENMKRVEDRLKFFERDVSRLSEELDAQSIRIVEFRNANIDALPTDLEYRLGRQSLLQERLAQVEREVDVYEKQRDDLIKVFETTGQVNNETAERLTPEAQQLDQLRRELDDLKTIYSDTNPNVQILKRRISTLEETVANQIPVSQIDRDATENSALDLALLEADNRIESLTQEIAPIQEELRTLELSITATASNAITLNALEREYENLESRYNSAVNRLDTAQSQERIEIERQGQRVEIIESAPVPQDPSGPNRGRIAAMGVGLGLGLAGGFFFLLEMLNRTIRRPSEIESRFNITPIASIPYIESRQQKFFRRFALIAAFVAVLIGVPLVLWYIDTNYMPLELIVDKVTGMLPL